MTETDRRALLTGRLTIRDHFAAMAPDVPLWFAHAEEPKPEPPENPTDAAGPEPAADQGWQVRAAWVEKINQIGHKTEHLREQYKRDFELWRNRDHMARLAQWRWAYADAMVRARDA